MLDFLFYPSLIVSIFFIINYRNLINITWKPVALISFILFYIFSVIPVLFFLNYIKIDLPLEMGFLKSPNMIAAGLTDSFKHDILFSLGIGIMSLITLALLTLFPFKRSRNIYLLILIFSFISFLSAWLIGFGTPPAYPAEF